MSSNPSPTNIEEEKEEEEEEERSANACYIEVGDRRVPGDSAPKSDLGPTNYHRNFFRKEIGEQD
jgi:hypothetical protein